MSNYAVGLFDVLGQKDILRSWQSSLPKQGDDVARNRLIEQLKMTLGVVSQFRRDFSNAFRIDQARPEPPGPLTPEQRSEWEVLKANPLQIFGFSDTVVGYVSLSNAINKVPIAGVHAMLAATALLQTVQLARGHPIRGGIEAGFGFEIDKDEIYGPALMRAYALESELAEYPRVLVGDELMQFLNMNLTLSDEKKEYAISRSVASRCMEFVCEDVDGRICVDFLGPGIRSLRTKEMKMGDLISKAAKVVEEKAAEYRAARNTKLAFRYGRLYDYFQQRLVDWEMTDENVPSAADRALQRRQ